MRSILSWTKQRHAGVAAAALLAVGGIFLAPSATASAKDYDIAGTVDCGVKSGHDCSIGNTVNIWTDDLGGGKQLATVDVSWIKKQLPDLDQDDPIDLEVQDQPDGTIQATGVTGEGDFVDRENFGVREEYNGMKGSIQANVGRAKNDDEKMNDKGIHRQEDLHHH
jgi:hypothetical protein